MYLYECIYIYIYMYIIKAWWPVTTIWDHWALHISLCRYTLLTPPSVTTAPCAERSRGGDPPCFRLGNAPPSPCWGPLFSGCPRQAMPPVLGGPPVQSTRARFRLGKYPSSPTYWRVENKSRCPPPCPHSPSPPFPAHNSGRFVLARVICFRSDAYLAQESC